MEAILVLSGLIALGILALRFGHDSRDGLRSPEHQLALHGLTWRDLETDTDSSARVPASHTRRPILSLIERTLALPDGALTDAPDADAREARAREVADEFWSDRVWITGLVAAPGFRQLLDDIAPDLAALPVVVSELASVAEPLATPAADPVVTPSTVRPDQERPAPELAPSRLPAPRPLSGAPVVAS